MVHHEGGHLRIYRAFFEGIKNAVGPLVSGIPNTGMIEAEACGAALTSLFKDVYDKQFQVAIAEADSLHSYNTGITWGSCDPPNPYMNETCPDGM